MYVGYHTWSLIHTMVAYYPDEPTPQHRAQITEFLKLLGDLYPCRACGEDFSRL
jgi:FAD-linked sulfhydryl oxidase